MIYLRKEKTDQQFYSNQNLILDLQNQMILFDEYFEQIRENLFINKVKAGDIEFKLFQLMDIYLRCMVIYKGLVLPNEKAKLNFFLNFSNSYELKEYVYFTAIISSSQIDELPSDIKTLLDKNFYETLDDFAKEHKYVIENYLSLKTKDENFLQIYISALFASGLCSHIGACLKPGRTIFELKKANGEYERFFDLVDNSLLYEIDSNQSFIKEIKDKPEFFKNKALKSYDYFVKLTELYLKMKNMKFYLEEKKFLFNETEEEVQKQFIKLQGNTDFQIIKNNCSAFEDYCYILIKAHILEFKNEKLIPVSNTAWAKYYCGEFLHDENLELKKHIPQIDRNFMNLF